MSPAPGKPPQKAPAVTSLPPTPNDAASPLLRDAAVHTPSDEPLPHPAPSRLAPVNGVLAQGPNTPGPTSPRPSAPPEASDPSFQSLSTLFKNNDYPTVVRVCSGTPVRTEIAMVCLLAACREHNTEQARRWLPANDTAKRKQLAAYCKERNGVDVGQSSTIQSPPSTSDTISAPVDR